jgi:hypothetical protein
LFQIKKGGRERYKDIVIKREGEREREKEKRDRKRQREKE